MRIITFFCLFAVVFVSCGRNGNAVSDTVENTVKDSVAVDKKPVKKFSLADITIEKEFLFEKYTLADTFPYKDTVRIFQFDKMRERLFRLDSIQLAPSKWGILQNRRNKNGESPLVKTWSRNAYKNAQDEYGVERYQSVALYAPGDSVPERYGPDGSLVKILGVNADSTLWRVECYNAPGVWEVGVKYVRPVADTVVFRHAVMVDRTNQDIAVLEKSGNKWLVRSMNPATTGVHNPPYAHETPEGMFVIQEKKPKMYYLVDGTATIAGYAPWASRFSNGGYLHGVPTNHRDAPIIEYSWTLGTVPRSHMCVRNASSHAKFIFDLCPVEATIVFVYD